MNAISRSVDWYRSNPYAQTPILLTVVTLALLTAFYFLGGRQALESSRTAAELRQQQESAQQLITENASRVQGMQEDLEAMRTALGSDEQEGLSVAEMRQRLAAMEHSLAALPRMAGDTRAEIDAAASRRALQNAEFFQLQAVVQQCESAMQRLREETVTWAQSYEPLLTNDRGRQIAADTTAVQNFAAALRGDFATVRDQLDWQGELTLAVAPLQDATAEGIDDYVPTAADRQFLETFLTRVQDANQALQRRRRAVDAILAATEESPVAEQSLGGRIEQVESELTLQLLAEATEARNKVLQQAIEEQSAAILQAEQERIAAETRLRVQQEQMGIDAAEQQTKQLSQDAELAAAKNHRLQLEKQFELDKSEIASLLGAFIHKGRYQPVPAAGLNPPRMKLVAARVPVSLGGLRSAGALDATESGREVLYRLGGSSDNDRRGSGFPNYSATGLQNPTIAARVERARQLLNQYGDLLVEKELLTP